MNVKSKIFYWYVAFLVLFIGFTLLPAPDAITLAKYHISSLTLRLLGLTFVIPEAIIWYIAFYAYEKIRQYSQLVKVGREGVQIAKIARGLLILSVGLPVAAIFSSMLTLIASHHHEFTAASVVIRNYTNVVFPLIAFVYISLGARGLSDLVKTRPRPLIINGVILAVITLGVIFCCLIVQAHHELRTTYHMSPQLVMLTLGIPYMYIWFLGLFASVELQQYSTKVAGIVYRRSWNVFIGGIVAIIFVSILLQYLTTLSTWLTSLSLGAVILLLYGLLSLLAAAYIVVALGAKKLTKIEEA
jgi:hypothetical protein